MIHNKKIIIFGGAGWLGSQLVSRLIPTNEITVYSRDESKHHALKSVHSKVRSIIGDVNNKDKVIKSTKGHDILINLAAVKQIHVATEEPQEACNTIINGALFTKEAAEIHNLQHACLISSDKACAPSNVYGCAKSIAESIFINNNQDISTKMSVCRYGNVAGSVNSIMWNLPRFIKASRPLVCYDDKMTRFNITAQRAIDLILFAITSNLTSQILIPKLNSYRVIDLLEIYGEMYNVPITKSQHRIGEKVHEWMFSATEFPKVSDYDDEHFIINPNVVNHPSDLQPWNYSSELRPLSKPALLDFLKTNALI